MALSYPKRAYAGRASAGTIDVAIGSGFGAGSTFKSQTSSPLSGWTDVTGANWGGTPTPQIVVALGYGTAYEEKILCTYDNAGQFTVVARGYDNTPQGGLTLTWPVGTSFVLVWSATEAAEANAAVRALQPTISSGATVLNSNSTASALTSFGTSPTLVTPNLGTPTAVNLANGTGLPTTGIASGALPAGVTLPYASLTGAPVAPAAATATASGNATISLTSGTTPLLSTTASPTGSFTNYTWHAMCKQQSGTITNSSDFAFVILQRLVGGTTWTAVANLNVGTAATALQYQNVAASGAWSSSGATDSEFQLGIGNTANTYTWTASCIRLTVIGLS